MNYYKHVLKNYAIFTGRSRRKEYWMFVLVNVIICLVANLALGFVFSLNNRSLTILAIIVICLYNLAIIIPSLAVAIRRLHDTSRSGWWVLIALIPFIGGIILIVLLALDSTPGANEYGANPKESQSSTATPAQSAQ